VKRWSKWAVRKQAWYHEGEEDEDERDEEYLPIAEPGLLRFERRHGITLPPDYRAFLLHVANGWYSTSMVNDFYALDLSRDYPQLTEEYPATRADAAEAMAEIKRWLEQGRQGLPKTSDRGR
jgi:SMI1 / KNR4 family (SUKH-1)